MAIKTADSITSLSWLGLSMSRSRKDATSPPLPQRLPESSTALTTRALSVGLPKPTTTAIVGLGLLGTVALSSTGRILIASAASPLIAAAATFLCYIIYKIGQFVAGKLSPEAIANLLALVMKKKTEPLKEVVVDKPAVITPPQPQATPASRIPNEWVQQYTTSQEVSTPVNPLVSDFIKEEKENMVNQFLEVQAEGQKLTDEFLSKNPALRRANAIQAQVKPEGEKVSKLEERARLERMKMRAKF